jgi:predicted nucleic-acid-binding protein
MMMGLDTNVLARLFVEDDTLQARQAREFVAARCTRENPGFVDRVALCELVWVLASVHDYRRVEIAPVIEKLLSSGDLMLEDEGAVRAALHTFRTRNVDFSDALIGEVNRLRGCDSTATFDRKAAKLDGFIRVS